MGNVFAKKCCMYFSTVLFILTVLCLPRPSPSEGAGQDTAHGPSDWREHYVDMFGARYQRTVSDASENWKVSLTAWESCPQAASNECFFFKISRRDGTGSSNLRLANETAQVDAVSIINASRAVILGRAMHNMYVITLVMMPSGNQLDHFVCYWPALAPDRHFVAYEKFSPAHPGYEYSPSSEYLAYDLTASAEDNRTPPNRGRALGAYDVGWPLYPQGVKNTAGDNMFEGHEVPVHRMASEGFFWIDESDTVAFVDRWEETNSLVVADLRGGPQQSKVRVYPLKIVGVVDLPGCKDKVARSDFEGWSRDPATLIDVTDIRASPENSRSLRLHFSPHPCLAGTVLEVPLEPSTRGVASGGE